MQIDDDNSKMMTAIMRMVSREFYAGYIHMHQMPDMPRIWGGGTSHKLGRMGGKKTRCMVGN